MKHFLFFLFFFSILIALLSNSYLAVTDTAWKKSAVYLVIVMSIIINVFVNTHYGKGNIALGPFQVDPAANDPFEGVIQKQRGRTLTAGYKEDFGVDNYINHRNTFDFLLFGSPTFRKYYHFNGYNPLTSAANFHGGLGNYQRSLQHLNFVDLNSLDHYLKHFSRWAGKYLITYNSPKVLEKVKEFPQLVLIHNSGGRLVYENTGAYPMVYLSSDISRPVEYEIGTNKITIRTDNSREDHLVVNVAPIEGYSYKIGAGGEYRDIEVQKILIKKDKEVCFDKGRKLDPCKTVRRIDNDYISEVEQKISPITIKIPANAGLVEVRYRDKYFYYGTYMMAAYVVIIAAWTIISRINRKNRPDLLL